MVAKWRCDAMSIAERFNLQGNVAVVTGAGGGIGTAAAVAIAESGADLALIGRNIEKLTGDRRPRRARRPQGAGRRGRRDR